jgi:hypothetical protein
MNIQKFTMQGLHMGIDEQKSKEELTTHNLSIVRK